MYREKERNMKNIIDAYALFLREEKAYIYIYIYILYHTSHSLRGVAYNYYKDKAWHDLVTLTQTYPLTSSQVGRVETTLYSRCRE